LGVDQREIRTGLVAPGVLRTRDCNRRLRLVLRPVQITTPEQRLDQLDAGPGFKHPIGTAECRT
jgi:hypothetical protein